jgi:AcrR family transcriptional regulator
MADDRPVGMRERTRRIVRSELTVVAQDLFVEHGYDATTVDQIAAAAGMSKRTFFRYFASKDDLVIGKYDLFGDKMADALTTRPADEPVWQSLRRVFDIVVGYMEDPQQRARNDAMERIVQSTPTLNAGYLQKVSRMQRLLVDGVRARLTNPQADLSDPRPAAIVGAAFACLIAAQTTWSACGQNRPFTELLDESMAAVSVG